MNNEEERRNVMPNNPYMFNGSRTAPRHTRKGGSRSKTNRRRRNRRRTRKNRKNY